mmetsp:Transcript_17766/g.26296  ORF Transcript_17766/g.26296 Transcript_17766/m.26296 type:complete len:463 (-) Transcript_17766:369-1757(-)|eukprot:CAMPEP_0194214800 /NCGR_PEP_ID=MMETSP0156-20130528/16175_1 /TAXON_ID=33649 /ORGANISM="Thalassionema nitzschioides, Strain L26-B" /LENGTH=462 /DNA_ID=CAMNT_0038943143 /DNA_START=206 /DNA_END=1594 /DNA_ORIENTATION=+
MPSKKKDEGRKKKKDEIEIIGPRTSATFMPTKLRLLASRTKYNNEQHANLLNQLRLEEGEGDDNKSDSSASEYYEAQQEIENNRRASISSNAQSSRLREKLEKWDQSRCENQKHQLSVRKESESSKRKTDWIRFRIFCGNMVNNEIVQIAMIVVIIINSLLMGVATFDFVTEDPEMQGTFKVVDRCFLVIYTIELLLQFAYFGWRMIQDAWLAFDFFVVVVSWAFDFVDGGGEVQIIRAFRIFRSFRLLTRIKVLRDLVAAISQVVPRLCAVGMLMLLVFYIFSVLFTDMFRTVEVEGGYPFATLHDSLFTSVELMTLEWGDFARTCMEADPHVGWIPFVFFIFMSGFIVVNLIIALICDAVSLIDEIARERAAVKEGIVIETPEEQLQFAQTRIVVLEERIRMMQLSHENMQNLLETLALELRESNVIGKGEESSIPTSIVPNFSSRISGIFMGKDDNASE